MYKVGDIVLYNGKLCEVKRVAGAIFTTTGTLYKYDLLCKENNILYEGVTSKEIENG